MSDTAAHIVRSYDAELKHLRDSLMRMGGLAEAQLDAAMNCVRTRDPEAAEEVVRADQRIDDLEDEINAVVIRLIALRQPMANDLREIVAALKIASDIERIGDYAANVAKRIKPLSQIAPVRPAHMIPRMGLLAQQIIKDVLDGYVEQDADKVIDAWHRDAEVDEIYTTLFRELLTYMMEDPRNITACTHLLFIAKNVERIGDHATNIAETIHFQIVGTPLGGERPKGDLSSFEVVTKARSADG